MEDRKEVQNIKESGREPLGCQYKDSNDEVHATPVCVHAKPEGDSAPHSDKFSIALAADHDFEVSTASSPLYDEKDPGDSSSESSATVKLPENNAPETPSLPLSDNYALKTLLPTKYSQSAPGKESPVSAPFSEICSPSGVNGEQLIHPLPSSEAADSAESLKEIASVTSEADTLTFFQQKEDPLLTRDSCLTVSTLVGSSEEGTDPAVLQCTMSSTETKDSMVDIIDGPTPGESMATDMTSRSELSCASSAKKSSEITQGTNDIPQSPLAASTFRAKFVSAPSLANADMVEMSQNNLALFTRSRSHGSSPIRASQADGETSSCSQKHSDILKKKPDTGEPYSLLNDKKPPFLEADVSDLGSASSNVIFSDGRNKIDGWITEKDITKHGTNSCQEKCTSSSSEKFLSEFSDCACLMPGDRPSRVENLQSLPSEFPNGHTDVDEPLTTNQNFAASPPAKIITYLPKQLDKSLPSFECLPGAPERITTPYRVIDRPHPPTHELPSSEQTVANVPSSSDDALTDNSLENLVNLHLPTHAPPDQAPESSMTTNTSSSSLTSSLASCKTETVVEKAQKSSQVASSPDTDAKIPLEQQVEYLSGQLIRTQSQLQSLLEEKHRWLVVNRPLSAAAPAASQGSPSLASEKAALVVKYAQSERLRCKAEARIKELEGLLNKNRGNSLTESLSQSPSPALQNDTKELQKQLQEMTKMLANSRERAETFRHSLRQEESRASDLNAKLTAAREAHRSEQKRAASQVETISRLNRELESARRQLKEADRLREREAERLCNEVAAREATEKLHRIEKENAALEARLAEMGESEKQREELKTQLTALQASYDNLRHLKSDLDYCQRRETQLSEFTRRLTERNAALQADYLSTQSRLEASERAVSEARQAADVAAELVAKAEAKLVAERTAFQQTIDSLETKVAQLTESAATLNSALAREREERNALRRKQHAQDRELARLLAVQSLRTSSSTTEITEPVAHSIGPRDRAHPEIVADNESAGNPQNGEASNQCNGPSDSEAVSGPLCPAASEKSWLCNT
uniref:Uncharacterized protein n=1 Tax=Schistocephalus solidus TaxID=70667 RepID=A0A0V0J785_SCHSO